MKLMAKNLIKISCQVL